MTNDDTATYPHGTYENVRIQPATSKAPGVVPALTALAAATSVQEAEFRKSRIRRQFGEASAVLETLLEEITNRIREVEELRRLAGCDALTGISNRRAFEDALDREVARHNRHGGGLAVLLLDLDGLKEINDTHGHAAGDEAIQLAAKALADTLRGTDLVARLGGDEFAVLITDVERDGVQIVARRLRDAVESARVAGSPLRISIGAATANDLTVTRAEMLSAADQQLYANKRDRKEPRTPAREPARLNRRDHSEFRWANPARESVRPGAFPPGESVRPLGSLKRERPSVNPRA